MNFLDIAMDPVEKGFNFVPVVIVVLVVVVVCLFAFKAFKKK